MCVLLALCLLPWRTAQAAVPINHPAQGSLDWAEKRTQYFTIIYQFQFESLVQGLVELYGEQIDSEYARFEGVFQASLPLPVMVRIYPDIGYYMYYNSLAPEIDEVSTSSHVGAREISLIGSNIVSNLSQWGKTAVEDFRYELAALFTEQLSNKSAPPALVAGISAYARDPQVIYKTIDLESLPPEPVYTWDQMWGVEYIFLDAEMRLEAASIVAYLVDAFGWQKLLDFLKEPSTAPGYREALSKVYGLETGAGAPVARVL
jgi:hypothetical protein